MRLGNLDGRAVVIVGENRAIDVEDVSQGLFPADPLGCLQRWSALAAWSLGLRDAQAVEFDPAKLGPPVPNPRQVFAIGLNYRDHTEEFGLAVPDYPVVFTKFSSCLSGPRSNVMLPGGSVDWEVELVIVMGGTARSIDETDAAPLIAGYMVGQDLSERELQSEGPSPQFSLAKSHDGFGPTGPWITSLDELDDPLDLAIECRLNGDRVQSSRTSQMIFPPYSLVAYLSRIVNLSAGDVIFTGTPAGVGAGRRPPRFVGEGDRLDSCIQGLGSLHQEFTATAASK